MYFQCFNWCLTPAFKVTGAVLPATQSSYCWATLQSSSMQSSASSTTSYTEILLTWREHLVRASNRPSWMDKTILWEIEYDTQTSMRRTSDLGAGFETLGICVYFCRGSGVWSWIFEILWGRKSGPHISARSWWSDDLGAWYKPWFRYMINRPIMNVVLYISDLRHYAKEYYY